MRALLDAAKYSSLRGKRTDQPSAMAKSLVQSNLVSLQNGFFLSIKEFNIYHKEFYGQGATVYKAIINGLRIDGDIWTLQHLSHNETLALFPNVEGYNVDSLKASEAFKSYDPARYPALTNTNKPSTSVKGQCKSRPTPINPVYIIYPMKREARLFTSIPEAVNDYAQFMPDCCTDPIRKHMTTGRKGVVAYGLYDVKQRDFLSSI